MRFQFSRRCRITFLRFNTQRRLQKLRVSIRTYCRISRTIKARVTQVIFYRHSVSRSQRHSTCKEDQRLHLIAFLFASNGRSSKRSRRPCFGDDLRLSCFLVQVVFGSRSPGHYLGPNGTKSNSEKAVL